MFKKKKGHIKPLSELHFISSLSLEESVLWLEVMQAQEESSISNTKR